MIAEIVGNVLAGLLGFRDDPVLALQALAVIVLPVLLLDMLVTSCRAAWGLRTPTPWGRFCDFVEGLVNR